MSTWQYTLGARSRDAIAAYYARYSDATPGEVDAWLRDRGFDVSVSDVAECMAALDSNPDWRTGWINRNIHRYSTAFDPDAFLATRGYGEDDGWQVVVDEPEDEFEQTEGEEQEDEKWDAARRDEAEEYQGGVAVVAAPAPLRPLSGEDRLPGMALAVFGLVVGAGATALIIAVFR